MVSAMTNEIAKDGGHWYAADGSPRYTIAAKDGSERATTLRDARKLGLLPSVTEILKCAAKPGLENWKQNQVMLAALTLPRLDGEDDGSFCQRVLADSREQAKKAAERGSALHGAIELHLQGRPYSADWIPHVEATLKAFKVEGIDLMSGEAERSFAHPSGYGGKVDWHSMAGGIVVDFKSKQKIDDKVSAYDEHCMQLAAYGNGLGIPVIPKMINAFIGVEDTQVKLHIWQPADFARGLRMFNALLDYWQTSKGYYPAIAKAA
jgi:hypothetical protein